MPRRIERDSNRSAEAVFSVLDLLIGDELLLLTAVIVVVFGLIWLLVAVFRGFFGQA